MNDTPIPRYDDRSRWLHWTTALLVAALWAMGETIDWFPRGTGRTVARSAHICVGVALAVVIVVRLRWRSSPARVAPPALAGQLGVIGVFTHRVLYALVAAAVLLGLLNAWVRGDSLFGLVRIPPLVPGNQGLRELVEELHEWAANTLVVVALVHAVGALYHHLVRRDDVLRRMLPPAP